MILISVIIHAFCLHATNSECLKLLFIATFSTILATFAHLFLLQPRFKGFLFNNNTDTFVGSLYSAHDQL